MQVFLDFLLQFKVVKTSCWIISNESTCHIESFEIDFARLHLIQFEIQDCKKEQRKAEQCQENIDDSLKGKTNKKCSGG
jgi:hypothetical protein